MFQFHEFVEHWASIYKPMCHVPGPRSRNVRFHLVDSYLSMVDFVKSLPDAKSPCVVMESNQEGVVSDRFDYPEYTLYFMVRATDVADGRAAMHAKLESKQHMMKFLAYVLSKKEEEEEGLDNLDLERAEYNTTGPLYDGWYSVVLTLSDVARYSRCIDENDYITSVPGTKNG